MHPASDPQFLGCVSRDMCVFCVLYVCCVLCTVYVRACVRVCVS